MSTRAHGGPAIRIGIVPFDPRDVNRLRWIINWLPERHTLRTLKFEFPRAKTGSPTNIIPFSSHFICENEPKKLPSHGLSGNMESRRNN
jgi:hypothetical protein